MKKIVISTLAVLVACPAFAGSGMGSHGGSTWQLWGMDPYIGLHGGMGFNNLNYSAANTKHSMEDLTFQGRVALGLEICDTARSEIEWSIYSKAKDNKKFGEANTNIEVESKLQTLMFNTYWEFGGYKIVRPFAGVGVGAAFTKLNVHPEGLAWHEESKTRVTAMGTLGVTFDMERFAVDIAARYNYVDIASGMHNIGGDIGIRFMF